MNFEIYLEQAWTDHATVPAKVADEFVNATKLIETNDQLLSLAVLINHVMGTHLARWSAGVQLLQNLKSLPCFISGSESDKTIDRSVAILNMGSGPSNQLAGYETSDQIRILAGAASALCEHDIPRATDLLQQALKLAECGLDKKDPANRAIAVAGNNIASTLEEKPVRSEHETALMILAAQAGRKYWELAGTWLEVERAEYRLAKIYLSAKDLLKSLRHAQVCLEICHENKAAALEMFHGYEALALIEKEKGNALGFQKAAEKAREHFRQLSADEQKWCAARLAQLDLLN